MLKPKVLDPWIKRENQQGRHLRHHLHQRHQPIFGDPAAEERHLRANQRSMLGATNAYARIRLMRSLGEGLFQELGATAPNFCPMRPVYHLTLVDRNMRWHPKQVLEEDEHNASLEQIRFAYGQWLNGLDCWGMLDFGLYVSCAAVLNRSSVVSVHLHALVWNISEDALRKRCRRVNRRLQSLLPGAPAALFKLVDPCDLRQLLWYVCKAPRSQHQVYQRATGTLQQFKRPINGVNAVRMHELLRGVTLDQLTIASGAGTPILRAVLAQVPRWRRNARRKGIKLRRPSATPVPKSAVAEPDHIIDLSGPAGDFSDISLAEAQ